MSALGEAKNGMRPGENVSSESRIACSRKGDFRTHGGRSVLCTFFNYIISPWIGTGHSGVGDETSIRFMVGKDIGTYARGKVNSEMTCKEWVLVKTTHERCGPFSLVVLSQRRGRVTTSSGPTLSETLSSLLKTKLSQNYSTLTQVRSRIKESKLTLHAVVVFWLKQTKQRKHRVGTPSIPSRERTTPREPKFHTPSCSSAKLPQIWAPDNVKFKFQANLSSLQPN